MATVNEQVERFAHAADEVEKALEEFALAKDNLRSKYALDHWREVRKLALSAIPVGQMAEAFECVASHLRGAEWDVDCPAYLALKRLAALAQRATRAERALLRAGFEDKGGEEWRPPVNEAARTLRHMQGVAAAAGFSSLSDAIACAETERKRADEAEAAYEATKHQSEGRFRKIVSLELEADDKNQRLATQADNLATLQRELSAAQETIRRLIAPGAVRHEHAYSTIGSVSNPATFLHCPLSEKCVVCGAGAGVQCNTVVRKHLRDCDRKGPCVLVSAGQEVSEHVDKTCVQTSPQSITNGYARINDTATLFGARAEAPTHPSEIARREGFNEGAEAMRAACREAVHEYLHRIGLHHDAPMWGEINSALEGAAP